MWGRSIHMIKSWKQDAKTRIIIISPKAKSREGNMNRFKSAEYLLLMCISAQSHLLKKDLHIVEGMKKGSRKIGEDEHSKKES